MLRIDGKSLTPDDVVRIARTDESVALSDSCLPAINASRAFVLELLNKKLPVYGITTGVGELSNHYIPPEQAEQLQENLIRSHAAN
ncbi:MAG: aromatic amino acid lyase, partial [Candidatus Neomarinimicrobiota bacterium]